MPKAPGARKGVGAGAVATVNAASIAFSALSKAKQKKAVVDILERSSGVPSVDPNVSGWRNFFQKSDGSYVIRDSYFYHNGRSPETLYASVKNAIEGAGLNFTQVKLHDAMNTWPKMSYLEVTFKVS